ncbi:peptidyl-prolyl cis-trans isomerase CYP38, chloroplastic [Elaeis guineensis]|uniref:peptidyl-prolyl cis-trans isomerase CYP38, chloroplastic n=1 Tax=Elaeis guineensis var. tenera TaxID=51953 RepID=UPI003C6D02AD
MHAVRTSRLFSTTHLSSPSPLFLRERLPRSLSFRKPSSNGCPPLLPLPPLYRFPEILGLGQAELLQWASETPLVPLLLAFVFFEGSHTRFLKGRGTEEELILSEGMCNCHSIGNWIGHWCSRIRLACTCIPSGPVLPDLSVLISGPPIKDPGALLRYALPINNKAIREVQKPLEDITDSLKVSGVRALDLVERNVRHASRALSQGRTLILSSVTESKKEHGQELVDKLATGMEELQRIVEKRDRDAVAAKQKVLLQYVGDVEEDMVDGFPYEVPEEYRSMPLLKGRATVDMKVKVKDNPNIQECVFHIVLDGYNAPVTAGNFLDLVERHFYDGMEIQRADGFVVQTGDPQGPAEGFIDPSTEKIRTIPLEIMVTSDKMPVYGAH